MAAFARLTAVALPGRLVYDNLKKTVLYLLPAGRSVIFICGRDALPLISSLNSFSELMPIVLNVVIGLPQILSNIQYVLLHVTHSSIN